MKHERFPPRETFHRHTERKIRVELTLRCEVRQGSRSWMPVRLENISTNGFRISGLAKCHMDTPLSIRIPGLQILTAYIRWKQGETAGCEFSHPLHIAVFDHIVRQSQIR